MIDSHAHLSFGNAFDADRHQVIDRMLQAGVKGWVEVGTDVPQSLNALALVERFDSAWATAGVHPTDVAAFDAHGYRELEKLLMHEKIVAVGEVGFDFYRPSLKLRPSLTVHQRQEEVLRQMVALAQTYDLPIVFHIRDAAGTYNAQEALVAFLRGLPAEARPAGVIHTFSGNTEHAREYLELGLYLSFSGVVTFKNAGSVLEVAKMCPADRMLIETDAPFLAPMPYRGERNEPAYVKFVAEKLADVRGVSLADIDRQTEENTRRLFELN